MWPDPLVIHAGVVELLLLVLQLSTVVVGLLADAQAACHSQNKSSQNEELWTLQT